MPNSYVRFTGDGETTQYTFAFPYLDRSHIQVNLDGIETVEWSFLSDFTVVLDNPADEGVIVEVRRRTPSDEAVVAWTDGSVVTQDDLNAAAKQTLYVLQEHADDASDGEGGGIEGTNIEVSTVQGAPGLGKIRLVAVGGTNPGTAKLLIFAGTSSTPFAIVNNIGSGF